MQICGNDPPNINHLRTEFFLQVTQKLNLDLDKQECVQARVLFLIIISPFMDLTGLSTEMDIFHFVVF
jgi:hypothetical protein